MDKGPRSAENLPDHQCRRKLQLPHGKALGCWDRWRIAAREHVFVAHAEILSGLARLLAKDVEVAADRKRDAHVDRLVALLARARHDQGTGALCQQILKTAHLV